MPSRVRRELGLELIAFRSSGDSDERHLDPEQVRVQLGPYSERYGCSDPFYEMKILHTGEAQACSFGLLPGILATESSLEEIWNHPWYRDLRRRLHAKRFEGHCSRCSFRCGSQENQVHVRAPGHRHSRESRLARS